MTRDEFTRRLEEGHDDAVRLDAAVGVFGAVLPICTGGADTQIGTHNDTLRAFDPFAPENMGRQIVLIESASAPNGTDGLTAIADELGGRAVDLEFVTNRDRLTGPDGEPHSSLGAMSDYGAFGRPAAQVRAIRNGSALIGSMPSEVDAAKEIGDFDVIEAGGWFDSDSKLTLAIDRNGEEGCVVAFQDVILVGGGAEPRLVAKYSYHPELLGTGERLNQRGWMQENTVFPDRNTLSPVWVAES